MSLFETYKIHHVGLILPSLDRAVDFMASMGLAEDYRGFVERWSCWCIFTKGAEGAAIELVVADDGPLKRFNKGFGGVHHFAYEVADIAAVSAELAARDIHMIEPEAIRGAGNFLCNFLDPLATRGIQIELVQPLG